MARNDRVEDDFDYCKQCKRIVPEGTEHDWVSHQPKECQWALRELGFNRALTDEQYTIVMARV